MVIGINRFKDQVKGAVMNEVDIERRKFIAGITGLLGLAAVGGGAVPFVRSFAPSTNVESERTIEVDLSDLEPGEFKKTLWQGKPVFFLHRTEEMIEKARAATTIEPEDDTDRVKDEKWLIVNGTCQHFGCIPNWNPDGGIRAWRCDCHGSEYDFSGRAIKGPTDGNFLAVPYEFLDENTVRVGIPKEA